MYENQNMPFPVSLVAQFRASDDLAGGVLPVERDQCAECRRRDRLEQRCYDRRVSSGSATIARLCDGAGSSPRRAQCH
jgi:hypothetical protein